MKKTSVPTKDKQPGHSPALVGPRVLKLYRFMRFLVFDLIVLGAAVRAFNAGLACPDWPLCFGDIVPDYHPQVYFEFIHRALAGAIGILFAGLTLYLWRQPAVNLRVKKLGLMAGILLLAQIIMGGLTVLELLDAGIVAGHLLLGLSFLAVISWIQWELEGVLPSAGGQPQSERAELVGGLPAWAMPLVYFTFGSLVGQIALGGLVASNYAGNVCVGFPLCNGQWVPSWSGALGLQVLHRFGAYLVLFVVMTLTYLLHARRAQIPAPMLKLSRRLALLIVAQVGVGIANVLLFVPALLTVLHSGLAAALLLTALRLILEGASVHERGAWRVPLRASPSSL